jgi:hypothetical protein
LVPEARGFLARIPKDSCGLVARLCQPHSRTRVADSLAVHASLLTHYST